MAEYGLMNYPFLLEAASRRFVDAVGSPTSVPVTAPPAAPIDIGTPAVTPLTMDQPIVYDGVTYDRYGRTPDAYRTPSLLAPPSQDYIKFSNLDFSGISGLAAPPTQLNPNNFLPYAQDGFSTGEGGDYSGYNLSDYLTNGLMQNPYQYATGTSNGGAASLREADSGRDRSGDSNESAAGVSANDGVAGVAAHGAFGKDMMDQTTAQLSAAMRDLSIAQDITDVASAVPGAFGTFGSLAGIAVGAAQRAAQYGVAADIMGVQRTDLGMLGAAFGLSDPTDALNDHVANAATASQIGMMGNVVGLEGLQDLGVTNAAAQAAAARGAASRAAAAAAAPGVTSAEQAAQLGAALGLSAETVSAVGLGYSDPVADFGMDYGLDGAASSAEFGLDDGFGDISAADLEGLGYSDDDEGAFGFGVDDSAATAEAAEAAAEAAAAGTAGTGDTGAAGGGGGGGGGGDAGGDDGGRGDGVGDGDRGVGEGDAGRGDTGGAGSGGVGGRGADSGFG